LRLKSFDFSEVEQKTLTAKGAKKFREVRRENQMIALSIRDVRRSEQRLYSNVYRDEN
jgi:hypothetical protein